VFSKINLRTEASSATTVASAEQGEGWGKDVSLDTLFVVYTSGKETIFEEDTLKALISFHQTHWQIASDTLTIIWRDYPTNSIYDIYPLISKITKNEPLILLFLDGGGHGMLQNAKAHFKAGFFANLDFQPMRTVFPPRTKFAYMAIGGQGSGDRGQGSDIFSTLPITKGYIIEEDKVFNTSKFPFILNTDRNNDGNIDDDIFETAMTYLDKDFELLMVHFHSIDNVAHEFGPYSPYTMQQIETVGSYIEQILNKWQGAYIIFSDHGLHSDKMKGAHGTNRIEDMVGIVRS
jgi:hypothetical protein